MQVRKLRWRFYNKTGGPRQIGLRCKDYAAGCIVCESYKFLDEHKRFPTFNEVHPIARKNARIEHEAWLLTEKGQAWTARQEAKRRTNNNANSG